MDATTKPEAPPARMTSVPGRTSTVVHGVPTTYVETGPPDGPAVVFLHGNPGSADSWGSLLEPVSAFVRCIAPDMPGYGPADDGASRFDYTIEGYERHLAALLDALGVTSAHIVGHDLGGVWGLAWAAAHPDRLASLTLMSIGAMPGYRWHRYARLYRVPIVGELVLRTAYKGAVKRVLAAGSTHEPPDSFVAEVLRQYRNRGTQRAVLAFYRGIPDLGARTVEIASGLRDRNPPTLVIWGAGDPYVPARFADVQKDFFPRAETIVVAGSGHWPLVDEPEAVTGAIVTFLNTRLGTHPHPVGAG
jgi:pimeloyl-ACP methyl ester carboxylesterase